MDPQTWIIGGTIVIIGVILLFYFSPSYTPKITASAIGPFSLDGSNSIITAIDSQPYYSDTNGSFSAFVYLNPMNRTGSATQCGVLQNQASCTDGTFAPCSCLPTGDCSLCEHVGYNSVFNIAGIVGLEVLNAPDASRQGRAMAQVIIMTEGPILTGAAAASAAAASAAKLAADPLNTMSGKYSAADITALTTAQIATMSQSDLATLTIPNMAALSTAQINALTSVQINSLTYTQLSAIPTDKRTELITTTIVAKSPSSGGSGSSTCPCPTAAAAAAAAAASTALSITKSGVLASRSQKYIETLVLPPIPLQKWVMVTIAREGRRFDIYFNDKLVLSQKTLNMPISNISNSNFQGVTSGSSGLVGELALANVYNYRITSQDIVVQYGKFADTRGRPYTTSIGAGTTLTDITGLNPGVGTVTIGSYSICPTGGCFSPPAIRPASPIHEWVSQYN